MAYLRFFHASSTGQYVCMPTTPKPISYALMHRAKDEMKWVCLQLGKIIQYYTFSTRFHWPRVSPNISCVFLFWVS